MKKCILEIDTPRVTLCTAPCPRLAVLSRPGSRLSVTRENKMDAKSMFKKLGLGSNTCKQQKNQRSSETNLTIFIMYLTVVANHNNYT